MPIIVQDYIAKQDIKHLCQRKQVIEKLAYYHNFDLFDRPKKIYGQSLSNQKIMHCLYSLLELLYSCLKQTPVTCTSW